MKKKLFLGFLTAAVLIGFGTAWFVYGNIKETPKAVQQTNAPQPKDIQKPSTEILKTGTFVDRDAIHKGSGAASIVKTPEGVFLKLENFSVTPGPDLYVYASPNLGNEDLGDYAVISDLQSFSGDQVYNMPADYERYKSIIIWCRSFSVTFTTADLVPAP